MTTPPTRRVRPRSSATRRRRRRAAPPPPARRRRGIGINGERRRRGRGPAAPRRRAVPRRHVQRADAARGLEYPLGGVQIAHGKFYEAGESYWLRDLEKIYLMRLALGPSGIDGPQPATAALLRGCSLSTGRRRLSVQVRAGGRARGFEGRFGVEVMLGIANDDMDISDLMAPYVKETLAGVAAKEKAAKKPKAAAAGSSSQGRGRGGKRTRGRAAPAAASQGGAKSGRPGGRATAAPAAALLHRRRRRRR